MNTEELAGQKIFCVSLVINRPGVRKKVASSTSAIETLVDRDMIHISKETIQCKEYEAVVKFDGAARATIRKKTAGNSYLREGIYLSNAGALDKVNSLLKEMKVEREPLVGDFKSAYEKAKADAQVRLGPMFDSADYPPIETVMKGFGFSWQIFAFPEVDALKEVSTSLWEQERDKVQDLWSVALEESRQLLRGEIKSLVDGLVDKLTVADGEKPKRFHKSALAKINDFIEGFNLREVSNDTELKALLGNMKDIMGGLDAKSLKSSDNLRDSVRTKLGEVKSKLDTMVVTVGRSYNLTDEETPEVVPESTDELVMAN